MHQTRHHLPLLHLACWCQIHQNSAIERCAQSSSLGLGTAASLPHLDECNALCLRMRYSAGSFGETVTCCAVQVLAVPLPRRPLFPGNIMPVSVQDPRLVRELLELKRSR